MLVKSVKVLPASIKSMNPMQKYPHIIELFDCTLNIFALMFLFLINSLISSEHVQHQNYRNKQFHFFLQNKAVQCVLTSAYS